MIDLTYLQSLPSESQLSLKIKCDDEWKSALFTYWHLVEDELIYGQLVFDEDENEEDSMSTAGQTFKYGCDVYDDCFVEGETHLHIYNVFDSEYRRCEIRVVSESKTQKLPLNFVSIPSQYYQCLCEKWREVHLAHDYMDQGWTDIIDGEGVEHLMDNRSLFRLQDDEIVIFHGEGLWIDSRDLHKLQAPTY